MLMYPLKVLSSKLPLLCAVSSHFTQVIDMVGLMVTEQVIVPTESV